ncbi:nucleotidyltransferase family protein [Aminobacter carboxidus]|uniref:Nucleotidyltransferase family protein n=1 Tax=Aminobacter carboxidus TaxID=376165 RepID=A0ABR9GKS0_9HYPH|nr:nucleotidyltransferase family protein [Aminobacter carboxidus]MBE1204275.1 nucleotidyltransferase family protein [Aminobacter carboxidus]
MEHLRYKGLPFEDQRQVLLDILLADPIVRPALAAADKLDLPQWMLVSGALYNSVWNRLTGRPAGHGIKDVDLFYFDGSDLSWEAEDAIIRRGTDAFAHLPLPVEIRNQARVHLWFEDHFGSPRAPLGSSAESLEHFASRTHAVGLALVDGTPQVWAPFGLDDIFAFRITPNHRNDNRATHEAKGRRARQMWPEVTVFDW